jgi:hypothetical protein
MIDGGCLQLSEALVRLQINGSVQCCDRGEPAHKCQESGADGRPEQVRLDYINPMPANYRCQAREIDGIERAALAEDDGLDADIGKPAV